MLDTLHKTPYAIHKVIMPNGSTTTEMKARLELASVGVQASNDRMMRQMGFVMPAVTKVEQEYAKLAEALEASFRRTEWPYKFSRTVDEPHKMMTYQGRTLCMPE